MHSSFRSIGRWMLALFVAQVFLGSAGAAAADTGSGASSTGPTVEEAPLQSQEGDDTADAKPIGGKTEKPIDQGKEQPTGDASAAQTSALSQSTTSTQQADAGSSTAPRKDPVPQPDLASGALAYSYPLAVPPGRNGMAPSLSLSYNSQNTAEGSIVGYGWTLDIPSIERMNKTGTDRLYRENFFTSSLSGELVSLSGSSYGARMEKGDFITYSFVGNAWTATDKQGTVYTFGATAASRQDNPADSTEIYKWMLEETRDTNGNFVRYEYFKENGQIYPSKIKYTGSGTTDGIFEVEFLRQGRTDVMKSFQTGYQVTTSERISEIQAKVNGSWVRKYALAYQAEEQGKRSLLVSISASGRDGSGTTTTLPAHQFTHDTAVGNLQQDTGFGIPLVPELQADGTMQNLPFSLSDQRIKVMDANGDGLKDLVKSGVVSVDNVSRPVFWVLRNTGRGFVLDPSWTAPTYTFVSQGVTHTNPFVFSPNTQVGDWNGDLRDDLILFTTRDLGGGVNEQLSIVLLSTGAGWVQDTTITADNPVTYNPCSPETPVTLSVSSASGTSRRFLDLNGDGLLDHIFATNYQTNGINCPTWAVWYNRNGKLVHDPTVAQPWLTMMGRTPAETIPLSLSEGTQGTDINADGLVDFLFINAYQQNGVTTVVSWAMLNTGHGWVQDPSFVVPTYSFPDANGNPLESPWTTTIAFTSADVNGDGLQDWIRMWHINNSDAPENFRKVVMLHTGNGWVQRDNALQTGQYTYVDYEGRTITRHPDTHPSNALITDVTGDGLLDIIYAQSIQQPGVPATPVTWAMINAGRVGNLVSSVRNSMGGTVDVRYKTTTREKSGTTLLHPALPMVLRVVERLTVDNGAGATSTKTYSYEGGRYAFVDHLNRKFAGFAKTTSTDTNGDKVLTYYHQGDASDAARGEYQDHFSKIGKAYRTERRDGSGRKFTESVTKWERRDLGNGRSFVFPSTTLSQTSDGGTSHRDTAVTMTYDAYGNPIQSKDWGEVAGNADGTFSDISDGVVITNTSYASGSGSAVKAAPCVVSVVDGSNALLGENRTYYDGLALCQVGKGNATKSEKLLIGTGYYASTTTRNAYGLPTATTDWKGNATTIAYDANNLYPATVTNALGHSVASTVDLATGQAALTTDQNGAKTRNTFDGLGRITKVEISDPAAPANWKTAQTVSHADAVAPVRVTTRKFNGATGDEGVEEIQYLDGFGNVLQSRSTARGTNQYRVASRTYDGELRVLKEMLPVFQEGGAYVAPAASDKGNQFAYDALGRVTSISNAVGTITTAYTPWTVEVTDANGHKKRSSVDGRGNTVKTEEINGAATYATTYAYDLLKRLVKITDAEGNIRDYVYDSLGRLKSQTMLHAATQAPTSYGTWTYVYDANDSIVSKTDPKGQVTTYTYDALNRLLTENFTGQTGTELANTYDGGTYGKGRLTSVLSQGIKTAYAYDLLGRTTFTAWTVNGVTRTQTAAYDLLGNPRTVTYPNGKTVSMTYDNAYQPTMIRQGSDTLVSNVDYAATGAVAKIDFGNGTSTVNTYDASELYRLTAKRTTKGATRYQDLTYVYDPVGNITRVVEAAETAAKRTVDYAYDDLDRLISASYASLATAMASPATLSQAAPQSEKPGTTTQDARASVLRSKAVTQSLSESVSSLAAATGSVDIGVMKTDTRSTIAPGAWNTYSLTVTNYGSAQAEYAYVYDPLPAHYAPATMVISCPACSYVEGTGSAEAYAEMALSPGQSITVTVSAQVGAGQTGTISNTAQSGYWDGGTDANPANNSSTDTTTIGSSPTPSPSATPVPPTPLPTPASAQSFSYSPTGNMLSSGLGTYAYEKTGFANPQAVTKVSNDRTYAYDKNGNLTSSILNPTSSIYTYDYRDRMIKSKKGTAPEIVYQYDHGWNRMKKWDKNGNKIWLYFGDYEMEGTGDTTGKLTTTTLTRINVSLGNGQAVSLEYNGSGTLVTKAYHHTDHLTGSSITTDQNGNLLQTLDYHPYGAVRVNGKTGTYDNKKKFTGKELDGESGLTYFGARYYDADIGRWMGWDPIQQDPATLLKSGELNGYGYVKNNPINGVDRDGLRAVFFYGTWGNNFSNTKQGQELLKSIKQTFGEDVVVFQWSGKNTSEARTKAAKDFADYLGKNPLKNGEELNIVAHSHGGNIALESTHYIDYKIDNLVTLATPIRPDYDPDMTMIDNWINAYSNKDLVQVMGGYIWSGKYVRTDQICYTRGCGNMTYNDKDSCARGGHTCSAVSEYGPADRTSDFARNINVTQEAPSIQTHTGMKNQKVWEKIDDTYFKDR